MVCTCDSRGYQFNPFNTLVSKLVCCYLIAVNPFACIPDWLWECPIKPSIWDLLFVAKQDFPKLGNERDAQTLWQREVVAHLVSETAKLCAHF
eukprot:gnl/Chilomastix_caulleri/1157.p1 GENE.gnl/Chilomastix_caulleri/1157~~gnl/Chilomastix_caulleri/1157.p1  ORF type:complete len:93 (-),score=3.04 gnl/Chilomastix_caulleri/1157:153-431(-)